MSQWTHVNGSIRVDGIPGMMQKPNLGIIKTWEDGNFDDATVPCGSEGSLQYRIYEVGNGLVWLNIQIWGDLRDYDNTPEIIKWINKSFKGYIIRSGIIEIDIEFKEKVLLQARYDEEKNDYIWDVK